MREKKEEMKERQDEEGREEETEKGKTSWTLYNIPGATPEA